MILKHPQLAGHLKHQLSAIYLLAGSEMYLIHDVKQQIKQTFKQQHEYDLKKITINTPSDWDLLLFEANSFSLFAQHSILEIDFPKKNFDECGKKAIKAYLAQPNPNCLIVIHASQLTIKQLSWLTKSDEVVGMQLNPLTGPQLTAWIQQQFRRYQMTSAPSIIALLQQHTQGNMLAVTQVIEKLLIHGLSGKEVLAGDIQPHLAEQSTFQSYELSDALIHGQPINALKILYYQRDNQVAPNIILWVLTQEIRQCLELKQRLMTKVSLKDACDQLKIWSSKAAAYKQACQRHTLEDLYHFLSLCHRLDIEIKTSNHLQIWHGLEDLLMAFCTSKVLMHA